MSSIVAVAGGSGGLGRAIAEALKADGRYKVLILARKVKEEVEKESGVRIIATDYSDVAAVTKFLEENNVDTVLSTISSGMDVLPELNLVQAAESSKPTRRFVPNIWSGFDYKPEHAELFPFANLKLTVLDALDKTKLEWTGVYPGLFLDYYTPGIPSYIAKFPAAVDVEANTAGIPGSGDYPVTFTHTSDIGKYTAALLGLDKWEKKYFLVADRKSWNELVALAEDVKGARFNVTYDSVEKLQSGQVTELPGHTSQYELFGGKAMVEGLLAKMYLMFLQGINNYGEGIYLNKIFPDIKLLGVEEALKRSFKKE